MIGTSTRTSDSASVIEFRPIGYIRRPGPRWGIKRWTREDVFEHDEELRRQEVTVEVLPEYVDALDGIEGEEFLWLIWYAHLSGRPGSLRIHPYGDPSEPTRGIFATRSPVRPNNVMLSLVRLVARRGRLLVVRGTEAYDGTPVLDLKPFSPGLDSPASVP
ncbi:MAG: tRNA (N6-threonylcarbamoyladenosine(37)-N6)-methyltransferase TrmO [Candidatus Korarchaeota archaeon]|nr:tRNA (N6-threonylcarbamoyladenosine(37)-N6)-methyltransferase TrmO [Candidatus Korarchaeota archaeon]